MAPDDLELGDRTVDIIGLYLHPPQHAAVFAIGENMTYRAPGQLGAFLPMMGAATEQPTVERHAHGTLSLWAALDLGFGDPLDKTVPPHNSTEFVSFLTDIIVSQPRGKEIFVVADNLDAHKSVQVEDFLRVHQTVHLHLIPTYSAWLTELGQWLSKIESDLDAVGVRKSGAGLKSELMRHLRHYHAAPKALKWKYFPPARRLMIDSDGTFH